MAGDGGCVALTACCDSRGPSESPRAVSDRPVLRFPPEAESTALPERHFDVTPSQFRSTSAWQRARAAVLSRSSHCALCQRPLYPDAPPRSRWSSSVDHVYPLHDLDLSTAAGRALAVNAAALRAVHVGCNSKRGCRTAAAKRRVPRIFGATDYKIRRSGRW
jgi:hypothetical protein